MGEPDDNAEAVPAGRPFRPSVVAAGAAAGVAGALVSLVILVVVVAGRSTPALTAEALGDAEQRWREDGPAGYDLDLVQSGRQSARYHVEVRQGRVTAMTCNDRAPRRRASWDAWSVPGQFEVIRRELEGKGEPVRAFGAPAGSQVVLRAAFDSHYGFPMKYERVVLGTSLAIQWEVTRFEVVR